MQDHENYRGPQLEMDDDRRPIEEILADLLSQYQPLVGSIRIGDVNRLTND